MILYQKKGGQRHWEWVTLPSTVGSPFLPEAGLSHYLTTLKPSTNYPKLLWEVQRKLLHDCN